MNKVGTTVLGLSAICAFAVTQGCVTAESNGTGRGAGARHKGPMAHQYNKKSTATAATNGANGSDDAYYMDDSNSMYEPVIVENESSANSVEPYVAPVVQKQDPKEEVYIVQDGDILSQIAVDFNTTTDRLISMNKLSNPDVLYVGQELHVPGGGSSSSSHVVKKGSVIKKGSTYEIQPGDTLSEIAIAANVGIDDLRSLNNIKGDQIFAGQMISIPSYGNLPSASSSSKKSSKKTKSEPAPAPVAVEPEPVQLMSPEPVSLAPEAEEVVEEASMQVEQVMDYMVYPGETLDDIARQYNVSKNDIIRLNNLTEDTAVRSGQRLRIPIAQ